MKANAKPERLTKQTAFYEDLNYDPTGRRLVVVRGPRQQRVERENEFEDVGAAGDGARLAPGGGGDATMIAPVNQYGRPHFTHDTTRVFYYDPDEGLVSIRWDGTDRKAHLKVTGYKSPRRPRRRRAGFARTRCSSPPTARAPSSRSTTSSISWTCRSPAGRRRRSRSRRRRRAGAHAPDHARRRRLPRLARRTATASTGRSAIRTSRTTSPPRRRR